MKLRKPTIKLHSSKAQVKHVVNKVQKQSKQKPKLLNPLKYKRLIIGSALILLVVAVGLASIPFNYTELQTVSVKYETQQVPDNSLEIGNIKVTTKGTNGTDIATYKYKESLIQRLFKVKVAKSLLLIKASKPPVNEVIANGTETGLGNTPSATATAKSTTKASTSGTSNTDSSCTTITLPFTTTYQNDPSLPTGQTYAAGGGETGSELTCPGMVSPLIFQPINAIVYVGTGTTSSSPPSNNGLTESQAAQQCQNNLANGAGGGTPEDEQSYIITCMHRYGY